MKRVLLKIDGMTCSACSSGLEKYLNKQDGVNAASVNLVMNNASVEYDDDKLTLADIEKFVAKAGFESLGIDKLEKEEKKKSREKYKLIVLAILAVLTMYVSMGSMIGLPEIPFIAMHAHGIRYAITLCILAIVGIIFGRDIIKNGWKNLIHATPNMDTLVMLGVAASMGYSLFSLFKIMTGTHAYVHELYFESAVIIISFIKIGKFVEGRNKDKTKEALANLMSITPNNATILVDGKETPVTIDEIKKGDIVLCRPGEKVAVDGTIVNGMTHIDESFITGESVPVKREVGHKVIAGSINYEGVIEYSAERIGRESTVSEIVRMVAEATNTKAPISRVADKISGIFVPAVITIAAISFVVWWIISKNISTAINIFVSVLVCACPCSLGLATPLAIVIASGEGTKRGLLIKSSEALENAHKVKYVVLDKTGTITNGKLTISKMFNYSEIEDNELLKIVTSIEIKSEHPIARAIVNEAKSKKIDFAKVEEFEAIAGYGVKAKINDELYLIGNEKLMKENNISTNVEEDVNSLITTGNSILFVAKNNQMIALLGVKDTIKDNVKDTISKLKSRGIEVMMLTGDNDKTAKVIASEVGINKISANVLPKDKAQVIDELKKEGLVMMCGDGINDSVSLVRADIGVSVSSGTDIAMDSSNVVIMNNDLDRINDLMTISEKTIKNIKQNLFWAFIYNVCMIPIAMGLLTPFGIKLNPMFGSIAMTLSSITVVLNALRLKNIKFNK